MANTKTAKKQILVTKRNHERNLAVKSKLKTMLKRARTAIIAADDQAAATEAVNNAVKTLYKSATKGIIKKQNASRRVGRLMLSFNKAFAEGAVQAEAAPVKKAAAKGAAKTAAKPAVKAPAKPKAVKAPVAVAEPAVAVNDEAVAAEVAETVDSVVAETEQAEEEA